MTDLTINAPLDTVNHYGTVGKVDIQKIDMNCYNECGNSIYVKLTEGKVVVKDNGVVDIIFADNTDGEKVAVIKENAGTINSGYIRVEQVDTANQARDGGIELKYTIYIDEDGHTMDEAGFVEFVEKLADATVSNEKQVEENAQKEKQTLPTGTFYVSPFTYEEGGEGEGLNFDVWFQYKTSDEEIDFDEIDVSASFNSANEKWNVESYSYNNQSLMYSAKYLDVILYYHTSYMMTDLQFVSGNNENVSLLFEDDCLYLTINGEGTATYRFTFDGYDEYLLEEVSKSVDITILVSSSEPELPESDPVCKIGDTEYYDLQEAFEDAKSGDSIVLIDDVKGFYSLVSSNDRVLSLDLNGHTIKGTQVIYDIMALSVSNTTLTILDSSEDNTGKIDGLVSLNCNNGVLNSNCLLNVYYGDPAMPYDSNGNPEIINGKLNPMFDDSNGLFDVNHQPKYLETWYDRPSKVTLLGGSYNNISITGIVNVEISGARVYAPNDQPSYNTYCIGSVTSFEKTKLSISSGVYVGDIKFDSIGSSSVSGGYFTEIVPSQYLAKGYVCQETAPNSGIYQVVQQ